VAKSEKSKVETGSLAAETKPNKFCFHPNIGKRANEESNEGKMPTLQLFFDEKSHRERD
jgi:hypothetical protein